VQAVAIHSKKSQGARTKALEQFKAGELRVLVATDLLSRGIDIESLPCVINYELPRSPKDYIHRVGVHRKIIFIVWDVPDARQLREMRFLW